eukprot:snap_masked-scaffold_13-processed-gene-0.37-mRNA-1 protein AED:1.00 eAED:1.00 QI:0/0/0/0/1/1/3/0/331
MDHTNPKRNLAEWAQRKIGKKYDEVFLTEYEERNGFYQCSVSLREEISHLADGTPVELGYEQSEAKGKPSPGKKLTTREACGKLWNNIKRYYPIQHLVIIEGEKGKEAVDLGSLGVFKTKLQEYSHINGGTFTSRFEVKTESFNGKYTSTISDKKTGIIKVGRPIHNKKISTFDACRVMWEESISPKLEEEPESDKTALKVNALLGDKLVDFLLCRYFLRLRCLKLREENTEEEELLTAGELTYQATRFTTNSYFRSKMQNMNLKTTNNPIVDASRVEEWIWLKFIELEENLDKMTRVIVEVLEVGIYDSRVDGQIELNSFYKLLQKNKNS